MYALILNLMYIGSKPKISPFSIKPHISRKSSKISVPQKILDLIQNRVLSNSVYLEATYLKALLYANSGWFANHKQVHNVILV